MDSFVDARDFALLSRDRYTFSVLDRILRGPCERILTDHERLILCLSAQGQFVLASQNAPVSMAALAKSAGLRGGGKPDFAQGKVPEGIGDAAERIGALLETAK